MQLSLMAAKVLSAFLEDATKEQYGFGLLKLTGVRSGSLYPLLDRLEKRGWVESWQEDIDTGVEGRPRRRLYRLTLLGELEARRAVAAFYLEVAKPPSWVPGLEGV